MIKKAGFVVVVLFAIIGFVFTVVFLAMQFGLLNVRGSAAERNEFFASAPQVKAAATMQPEPGVAPEPTPAPKDPAVSCVRVDANSNYVGTCPWNSVDEWNVIRNGLAKDAPVIRDVATKTQLPPRLIAAVVVPEQLRFFTSERESFKQFFEPLKVLGAMTKFSLGVSGVKVDTARRIEQSACDPNSEFYPGPGFCVMLSYPGSSDDNALYARLTDQRNHYYSFLYTAIYLKEVQAQWQRLGYDISGQPGVNATLFNIGFNDSHPKPDPQLGGSTVTLNGVKYSFGELGQQFFDSDELVEQLAVPEPAG